MTDYTWPSDLAPFVQSFYLQPHTGRSQSPLSRQMKTYELSAPRWLCRMTFRGGHNGFTAEDAYGPRLDALIAKLKGGANRVAIYDFRRPQLRGINILSTIGNLAAAAGAATMTLTGLSPYDRVHAGDYIGGDGRPHLILDDADADASGNAVISFGPPLAAAIALNAAVLGNPTGLFRLISDDAGANETAVGEASVYQLDFVEDL